MKNTNRYIEKLRVDLEDHSRRSMPSLLGCMIVPLTNRAANSIRDSMHDVRNVCREFGWKCRFYGDHLFLSYSMLECS